MRNRSCRILSALALLLFSLTTSSQAIWRKSNERLSDSGSSIKHYAVYEIDFASLRVALQKAPEEGSRVTGASLVIPKWNGELLSFTFKETRLFTVAKPSDVQIKTFTGRTADGRLVAHLTISDSNIQGIVTGSGETWFIATPRVNTTSKQLVEIYDVQGRPFKEKPAGCSADGEISGLPESGNRIHDNARTPSVSCAVKTYRLAIAGTADYTAYFGSQSVAFSNTVALVNNLNAIYEREMGVRFTLATDQTLMYTDEATEPFTNSGASPCSEITISRANFVSTVGVGNYDLGITVYAQNFGGCAYVGATCSNNNKGGAVGGYSSPMPTSYLLEVCAHEIGHLFSAGHSHNATGGTCTINASSAWEPGGGSTIMAYTGCSPSFDSYESTLYFHGGNLAQMRNYIASSGGCYTTGAANTSPLLTAPTDATFHIPVSTPFRLYATATDTEDQNTLTYTFDQMNLGTGSPSLPSPATASGPVFRSFAPSANSFRYLPRMDSIVAGITPAFESLPSVNRNLTFYATVRDNRPGCGCQSVDTINVATSGSTPFRVTSQASGSTVTPGSSVTITWDVAGTTASPFNTTDVQILFAGDGLNYTTILVASTPNDGSQQVTLPNIITSNGRIMVAAIGNLFFDINDADITVQTPCGDVQRNRIYPETTVNAVQGSVDLQLAQTASFGIASDGFNGEITASDPTGIIGFRNSSTDASCSAGSGFSGRYEVTPFYTVVPGNYEFTRTLGSLSGTIFFSLYGAGGYNSASVCDNFLYSNVWRTSTGISYFNDFDYTLAANSSYNLAFEVRSTTAYGTYRVNVRGPGPIFTEFKNAGNSYSYVVINSSGVIISVASTSPDLRTAADGTYYVYGVSHSLAVNLNSYIGQSFDNVLYGNFSSGGCVSISNNRREVVVRSSTTLPLTYVQLTAAAEAQAVRLRWSVSEENDAAGAEVEHSADGTSFAPIATLQTGDGRTGVAQYAHYHRTPLSGKNFYRIKQAAKSGGWLYSNTAAVQLGRQLHITVTPNPTSGNVTISSFTQQPFVPFALRVYDNKGRLVGQYLVNQQVYRIDLSALPGGSYLLTGDGISKKILKQ